MLQSCPVGSSVIKADRSSDTQTKQTKSVVDAVAHILGINNLGKILLE